jgi:pilus assembly protein CpaB
MKPKNLILIGVAVVCGLVAAFLTAQMTAGAGKKAAPVDMVEVPVAAKDIPIGTKMPKTELESFFVKKNFPKEAVPPSAILSVDDIGDKRTMRTIRQGETVGANDVNAKGFIDPPDGMMLMTTPISLDQSASGFALPGYKVVVIATKRSQKKNVEIVFPLFLDALILAVDTSPSAPQAGGNGNGQQAQGGQAATAAGFQSVSMISFAVTPEESILLAMAARSEATLRIGLPNQVEDKKKVVIDGYEKLMPTRDQILDYFADRWPDDKKDGTTEPVKPETVKVKVPSEAVTAGTQLTQEVLEKKFKTVEYPKDFVLEAAAGEDKDLLDKFAHADLVPTLLVPKAHLGKEAPKKPEENTLPPKLDKPLELVLAGAKAGHGDDAASPKGDTDTSVAEPKPKEYVFVLLNTPQGRKYQKFEVTEKGNKYVGDVTEDDYQQYLDGKGGTPKK